MAFLSNALIGLLLFGAIVTGFTLGLNDWYGRVNPTASQDVSSLNVTGSNDYLEGWGRQTMTLLGSAQSIPVVGGFLVLLTGVFQSMTLLTALPGAVLIPTITAIGQTLLLPGWFMAFALAAILVSFALAILNAMKGGAV